VDRTTSRLLQPVNVWPDAEFPGRRGCREADDINQPSLTALPILAVRCMSACRLGVRSGHHHAVQQISTGLRSYLGFWSAAGTPGQAHGGSMRNSAHLSSVRL
jgi:hypothetical protein